VTPIITLKILTILNLQSSQANELWLLSLIHFFRGTNLLYLVQKCNQLHEVKYPIRLFHQDPTRANHTLDLRAVLLRLYLVLLFDQVCRDWETDLRVNRIFDFQRQLSLVSNRINQWGISKHLHCRIFSYTHHKIHKLRLFICFHGYLVKWWFSPCNALLSIPARLQSQQSSSLCRHSHP